MLTFQALDLHSDEVLGPVQTVYFTWAESNSNIDWPKLLITADSAHMNYGVWIKASPQLLFPAEPFWIDSDAVLHMNLIDIEFNSAHVKYSVWTGP